ncbi:MAG: putative HIT-like protein [Fibrobacteres bacterium]|nr:putative HIT-like protein [Fibrobacterota bacterium]
MPSIFSRIIKGEIPCEKILEDADFFAFLDIRPINPGHTLVVPKIEVDELFEVADDVLRGAMPFAKRIARALKQSVPCRRIGVLVAGFEVPHAHIHLVPIEGEGELSFSRARAAKPEDLAALGERIREHL